MLRSRIKAKLAKNEPTLVTTVHFSDPSAFELASLMGFDGIWLDLEHHAHSVEAASNYIRATRVGVSDVIARPAKGEFMRMGRLLEAGAKGIMYPRCDDAEEAAEVVRWSKFAPLGERGIDGANPDMPYCSMGVEEYTAMANRETFIVIQIESPTRSNMLKRSQRCLESIFCCWARPTFLCSVASQDNSITRISWLRKSESQRRRNAGKHWGTTCPSKEAVKNSMELGARLLCYGADILIVKRGLEQIRDECSPLGFSFDGPAESRVIL